MSNFFAYGTLAIPEVMAEMTGRRFEARPARVHGFARRRLRGRVYPAAVPDTEAWLEGWLYLGIDAATLARIDRFEGRQYERRRVEVVLAESEARAAELYVLREPYRSTVLPEPWDGEAFARLHLPDFLQMCAAFRAAEEARAAELERR